MTRHLPLAAVLLMAALSAAAPAAADVPFSSRTSVATIKTSNADFSDVSAMLQATVTVPAGASGKRDFTFYSGPNLASVGAVGTGGINASAGISFVDPDPVFGYTQVDGSAVTTGAAGGSFTLSETFTPSTQPDGPPPIYRYADGSVFHDPAINYLPAFTQTSLPTIEYFLPFDGANLVDEGGSYFVELMISGNFSTTNGLASGSGQHFLSYINPDFKILDNFVYDAVLNQTRFTAINPTYSYDAADPTVHLDVFFFGAPASAAVPEPASWTMMILGFGLAGSALRMRQGSRKSPDISSNRAAQCHA